MSDFAFASGTPNRDGTVSFGGDDRLWVRFFANSVQNNYQSEQQGRPIFEKRDFIEIIQPGERDRLVREANDGDKQRFPRHWEKYQAGNEQVPDGTPLAILYPHEPHICESMQAIKIHTIDQLAGLNEAGIQRLGMGGRDHVERAKRFLEAASNFEGAHKMQAEIDRQRDEIAVLTTKIEQLLAAKAETKGRRSRNPDSDEE